MSDRKPKLVVTGCSLSDRTRVPRCYGDYLSEILGLEYLHLAKGATSNDRIWRVLTKHILDGVITSDDIVVVQYTDIHRREFPSYGHNYENFYVPETSTYHGPIEKFQSSYQEDQIYFVSHYKADSRLWQANECDEEVHTVYQKNCSVEEFDIDYFYTRHVQFEAFCELHNIKLVIFWCRYTGKYDKDIIVKIYGHKNLLLEGLYWDQLDQKQRDDFVLGYDGGDPTHWDNSHFNDAGHRFTAERLAEHIRSKNLL